MNRIASRTALSFLVVAVAALTSSCDSGGTTSAPASASVAAATASTTASAAAKGTDVGADELGTFVCADVKDSVCVGPTDRFPADAPVVHVRYKTKDLPKNDDVYKIQWIAEDVGKAAPPNTVIRSLDRTVVDVPDFGLKSYAVNTELSKPDKGWPVGKYRVEIKRGDELVTTARFLIE